MADEKRVREAMAATKLSEKPPPKLPATLTVREAMAATKLSEKAIRRRIERGQLRKLTGRDGLIRIPRADLEGLGLLPGTGVSLPGVGELGLAPAELLDRIVEQAEQLGRYRLLSENVVDAEAALDAERRAHDATRTELFKVQAEAKSTAAQSQPRRSWWRRG